MEPGWVLPVSRAPAPARGAGKSCSAVKVGCVGATPASSASSERFLTCSVTVTGEVTAGNALGWSWERAFRPDVCNAVCLHNRLAAALSGASWWLAARGAVGREQPQCGS